VWPAGKNEVPGVVAVTLKPIATLHARYHCIIIIVLILACTVVGTQVEMVFAYTVVLQEHPRHEL